MNNNHDSNNGSFKSWKCRVDQFRGFMKAKIEELEEVMRRHTKGTDERRKEYIIELKDIGKRIGTIEEYMTGKKAVKKYKVAVWGFLGGVFMLSLGLLLRELLPRLFG